VRHPRLDTNDFAGPNLHAVIEGRQAVSVLVQFQWRKVPAAHLLFADVRTASIDHRRDVSPVVVKPLRGGSCKVSFLSVEIEASECWVTLLPSSFGGAL